MKGPLDPLKDLRDIHLPDPVSFWPPALGWWIAFFLFIGLVALGVWAIRRFRMPTAYRAATQELRGLRESYAANQQDQKLVRSLSVLLRRYAMARYGREQVAGLTGNQWLSFLNDKGKTTAFTDGAGRVLASAPYRSREPVRGQELLETIEQWLKNTKRRRP